MRLTISTICGLLTGTLAATNASAEQYDFEAGLSLDSTRFDGSQTISTAGGTIFNSGETDTDDWRLFGSWYFAGLSDDKGPRARAVLVDRASSLSFGYSRTEQTNSMILTSNDPAFPFPPVNSQFDTAGDSFVANLRYVDRDSGWFGTAGLLTSDTSLSGFVNESFDATGWRLGGGRYILDTTTLALDVSQVNSDGGDATAVALMLEHLGDLGASWQYGVDVGYSRVDADGGAELDTWRAAVALYPNRDFEFGVAVEDVSGLFGQDTTGVEVFASWFVKPNVSLSAKYRIDDSDYFGNVSIGGATRVSDADNHSFGISATVRFK
ncbi:MAG: hypothetical protein K0U72_02910 [Gammaproteobacteria bacterium]|nr:hypothetical protein [Gammaproteobacteria bacterium]